MADPRRRSPRVRIRQGLIIVRISDVNGQQTHHELEIAGLEDRDIFARAVHNSVVDHPRSPLVISITGHQPWLAEVLSTSIIEDETCKQIADLNREVLYSGTARFPEKARQGKRAAWLFIVDQINVPEVYHWSINLPAPRPDQYGFFDIRKAKFRTGVWMCAKGACRFDPSVSVIVLCTRPDRVSNAIVSDMLFDFLQKSRIVSQPITDDEWLCWIFSRLHWLLTDWQNIIREVHGRLEEAEINSYHRNYPVKYRTRTMHREIALIHELRENLRFHTRCFRRLQRLYTNADAESRKQSLWQDVDDAVEDLEQHEETLNSLKERLDNLLGLEFNIQSADQSEGSSFLSVIATLFLPVSYLTSLWGISSSAWAVLWYICAAVPIFVASIAFLILFPTVRARWQKVHYRMDQAKGMLRRRDYTMLGAELPENVDTSTDQAYRARHRSMQVGDSAMGEPSRRESGRVREV